MVKFGKKVVKFRIPIIIISILLLIPATLGYINTRVNYDVLTYLPEDIETMQGQDILVKDFGTGAFSMFIVDGISERNVCDCYGYKKSGRKRNSGLCTDCGSFGDIRIRYYHGIIFRSVTFYA